MSRLTDEELAAVFGEAYQAAYNESMATYSPNAFHGIRVDGATGNAVAAGIRAVADAAVAAAIPEGYALVPIDGIRYAIGILESNFGPMIRQATADGLKKLLPKMLEAANGVNHG